MTEPPEDRAPADPLPTASVRKRHWGLSIVWVVPIVAAIVAGYLVYGRLAEFGPTITITFKDASGVKFGQTEIRYRGVALGEVVAGDLSEDHQRVLLKARLRRSAAPLAREGSLFWIVRPEVGLRSIRGLSTVITGSYIEVLPGTGKPRTEFVGVENPPPTLGRRGLKLTLVAAQLGSVKPGSPVHFRGIDVGSVSSITLSHDATAAQAHVFIEERYARLVRVGSRFWDVSGLDIHLGLFRGLEINLESLRSLATGGIAFASPDDASSPPAKDGATFPLHDKPQKEWLEWKSKIAIPPGS